MARSWWPLLGRRDRGRTGLLDDLVVPQDRVYEPIILNRVEVHELMVRLGSNYTWPSVGYEDGEYIGTLWGVDCYLGFKSYYTF